MKLIYLTDGYKYSHKAMYPDFTTKVISDWTPRAQKYYKSFDGKTVHFGVTYLLHELDLIAKEFFSASTAELSKALVEYISLFPNSSITPMDWLDLHSLGYLPLKIKSLAEGTPVSDNTPVLTIENTDARFFWLTNYLETYISQTLWLGSTNATYARDLHHFLTQFAKETADGLDHIQYQAHDFSARGMASHEASIISGLAHLQYFKGSDTMSAVQMRQKLYGDAPVGIVPATEHAVMCAGGKENERATIARLIEKFPTFVLSVVSDTWDYFDLISNVLPSLKKEIMARDGKFVVRPDSGNPLHIICGNPNAEVGSPEYLGSLNILAKEFGYTVNSKGYKVLHPSIGLIYGDGMNMNMILDILKEMKAMGFSSENVVFGIGSYQYQYSTRDTFSFAMKATYAVIGGEGVQIFKEPKTDAGKNSHKGISVVFEDLTWIDGLDSEHPNDIKKIIFENGNKKI